MDSEQKPALFVCKTFSWPPRSGADIATMEIARRLSHSRQVILASTNELQLDDPITFYRVDKSWRDSGVFARAVRRIIQRHGVDFVHLSHWFSFKDLTRIVAACGNVPIFYRVHSYMPVCPKNIGTLFRDNKTCPNTFFFNRYRCLLCMSNVSKEPPWWKQATLQRLLRDIQFYRPLSREVLHAFQRIRVFAVTNKWFAEVLGRNLGLRDRVVVIPNGVDTNLFRPCYAFPEQDTVYLPGRTQDPLKGLSLLLDAVERMRESGIEFKVRIDQNLPNMPSYVETNSWTSHQNMPSRYYQSSVVAIPTLMPESFPLSALEAMSCGRPVIASRTGGLPDIIEEGKDGMLFEPGDPRELSLALLQLAKGRKERHAFGIRGSKKARSCYDWDTVYDRYYRDLFDDFLNLAGKVTHNCWS